MSYATDYGYTPREVQVFEFTGREFADLLQKFVNEKTGHNVSLTVGCYEEDYDVHVAILDEDELDDDVYEAIRGLGLHPEEEFVNRDILLEKIFGSVYASVERLPGETYIVTVPLGK
ncbi:hypothetical protein IMZ31_18810 (plasmid) [Pontibacillus sp. ALD_SL1]|uniref:hypothetical protein n=1 Tax=Pontibacillus sp. ALD_SL1 TaxID=2777185 RepID=UPI001A97BE0F|nr:hypothetical protein [Pontibacillus sp. ALD_SL1]QST02600.1 hypothetical protein IMZ31_18810 [Pontibacillus sp. ALD_SL1]